MINLERKDWQALTILKRIPEFSAFIDILKTSRSILSLANSNVKDEILFRWNQGRVQEMDDILTKLKTSDEELKAFNAAPRKSVDI